MRALPDSSPTESADDHALLNCYAVTFHIPLLLPMGKTSFFQVGDHSRRMVATLMARVFPLAHMSESLSSSRATHWIILAASSPDQFLE